MERKDSCVQVSWWEEHRLLTLEGEPVLEYNMALPRVEGAGGGGRRISRYYARMGEQWRRRWGEQVYWMACLELADCRARSRQFCCWRGRLWGETTLLDGGLLSLRLEGEEIRGDGKPCQVCWGDSWRLKSGAPCLPGELLGGERGWRRALRQRVLEEGRQRRAAGEWMPDPDWEERVRRSPLPLGSLHLTPEGARIAYPQCSVAPGFEGTPLFSLGRQKNGAR